MLTQMAKTVAEHAPMSLKRGLASLRPAAAQVARRLFATAVGERLPTHEGEIRVEGIRAQVTIGRDRFGVPYIDAADEEDLWFGLGFCQAQDRPAQLEIMARLLRGSLAEVIGDDGIAIDRFSRRIGFRRAAVAQHAVCGEPLKRMFSAFARGLNQGLCKGGPKLDHTYLLLQCQPTRWEPVDLQAYCISLCFALPSNWDMELLRLKVLAEDGPQALVALDSTRSDHLYLTSGVGGADGPISRAIDHLAVDLETFSRLFGTGGGSNVWAVAPDKTKTGRPILASDPHLGNMAPIQAYLSRLRCPELEGAGASFIGLPGFLTGHNGHAAWGIAAAHADNTDIFLEQIGPDGVSVRQGNEFVPCEVIEEVIQVKGREPIVEKVLLTPRGPIISPALEEPPTFGAANALSIAGTWLAPRPYLGMFGATGARSFEAFRRNFAAGSVSTVTPVYADASGQLGWQLAVELPRRKKGHGLIPLPGWQAECGWDDGVVPFDDLPYTADPEEGFLVAANNQPVHEDPDGPYLGSDWMDDFRAVAIAEALRQRDDWDPESTARLQLDTRSIPWREIRERVLATPAAGDAELALDLLRGWDGQVASDSVGAAVYELFMAKMIQRIITAQAPGAARWLLGRGFSPIFPHSSVLARRLGHLVTLIREQPPAIFDSWEAEVVGALSEAIECLRSGYGQDPSAWQWGAVRTLTLVHPFGEVPPLNLIFNVGPLPGSGDASTIVQGQVDFAAPTANQLSIPILRAVYDVGNWDECTFALAGGQSGNPCSPHHTDQLELWRTGKGLKIGWSDEAIARAVVKELKLIPC